MKKFKLNWWDVCRLVILVIAVIGLLLVIFARVAHSEPMVYHAPALIEVAHAEEETNRSFEDISHARMVWMYALEWCESSGNVKALNPKDLDGTPSYGSYQFKPSTLKAYAKLYDVGEINDSALYDWDTQRAVLEQMVLHSDEINWNQQFPGCVKKIGLPPSK